MNGIFLINKPINWTSRDVCNKISHTLKVKKVGHSGTLDPFATGLLFVAIGNASKALPYIYDDKKTYRATLLLGKKTDSGDCNGKIIEEKSFENLSVSQIKQAIESLKEIKTQIPPMTSAIHYNGVKLYKLAHQGIEVDRKAKEITVYDAKFVSFVDDKIEFTVTVSKGTYIRVLGEQLAEKLHTVGYLSALRREAIGPIKVKNAIDISQVSLENIHNTIDFIDCPKIKISNKEYFSAINGKSIIFKNIKENIIALVYQDKLIAIYKRKNNDIFISQRGLW